VFPPPTSTAEPTDEFDCCLADRGFSM
jgi:hypothetical protein